MLPAIGLLDSRPTDAEDCLYPLAPAPLGDPEPRDRRPRFAPGCQYPFGHRVLRRRIFVVKVTLTVSLAGQSENGIDPRMGTLSFHPLTTPPRDARHDPVHRISREGVRHRAAARLLGALAGTLNANRELLFVPARSQLRASLFGVYSVLNWIGFSDGFGRTTCSAGKESERTPENQMICGHPDCP
jgi:hypothetical protein